MTSHEKFFLGLALAMSTIAWCSCFYLLAKNITWITNFQTLRDILRQFREILENHQGCIEELNSRLTNKDNN